MIEILNSPENKDSGRSLLSKFLLSIGAMALGIYIEKEVRGWQFNVFESPLVLISVFVLANGVVLLFVFTFRKKK